ncbi:MAG: GNAT family N-acetyltransferase [Muribaculaceae bacterium]|nr:GNAT family N-acetyltransferase [Muribaculaceae bacterium]
MIELRPVEALPQLLKWRREVIENVFDTSPSEQLMLENQSFYRRHLADGSHLAFEALCDNEEAGCGSLCLYDELPSPDNPTGRCGYLMNIYVRNKFREKGVGHAIVSRLIDEAKIRNCHKIYLETTPMGRHLYESLGFHDLPDMMKLSEL